MVRTAVVTGAAGGIGAAVVRLLVDNGWTVMGVDTQNHNENYGCSMWINGDVSEEGTWRRVANELENNSLNLNLLVNNAAIMYSTPVTETELSQWDAVMSTNVRSCFLAVRALQKILSGGAIVNIASVHAVATSSNVAAYAASKGAIVALSRELAIELAADEIRVNAVLPGAVDTPMLRNALSREQFGSADVDSRLAELANRTVNGRIGIPEEIAEAVMFLGDNDRSSFVNGASLVVDGGATIRLSTE